MSRLAEPGGAVDAAVKLAERIAKNAPLALSASKELVKASQGRTEDESWGLQQHHSEVIFTSNDALEGSRAFAEKRPPQWSGT